MPNVLIGAINGDVGGAAMLVAAACDVILASERASFATTGPAVEAAGVVPAFTLLRGLDMRARRILGWAAFTGHAITAAEAQDAGLVTRVVPHDQLRAAADTVAASAVPMSPVEVGRAKALLNHDAIPYLQPDPG